jgi:hypothetical protein
VLKPRVLKELAQHLVRVSRQSLAFPFLMRSSLEWHKTLLRIHRNAQVSRDHPWLFSLVVLNVIFVFFPASRAGFNENFNGHNGGRKTVVFWFWRKVSGNLFNISTAELKSSQRYERNSMPYESSWMVRQHKGHVCEGDQNLRVHTCFV